MHSYSHITYALDHIFICWVFEVLAINRLAEESFISWLIGVT